MNGTDDAGALPVGGTIVTTTGDEGVATASNDEQHELTRIHFGLGVDARRGGRHAPIKDRRRGD